MDLQIKPWDYITTSVHESGCLQNQDKHTSKSSANAARPGRNYRAHTGAPQQDAACEQGPALLRTSKTMRTTVKDSDAVVEARSGVNFSDGPDLLYKLTSLSAYCNVTVLRFWFPKSLESWLRLFLVCCNTKDKPLQTSAFPINVGV